jgi:Ala-tRNA(Pro) deacylase
MLDRRTRHLLDHFGVSYLTIASPATGAATGSRWGAGLPRRGKRADVVLARVDGRPTLVLVPHAVAVDVACVAGEANAISVHLSDEREFRELFPGCAPGEMPPLGRLWGVDVFADRAFAVGGDDPEILLPLGGGDEGDGRQAELLALRWADLVRLTNPLVGRFTSAGGCTCGREGPGARVPRRALVALSSAGRRYAGVGHG